jgi:hypothetical protein
MFELELDLEFETNRNLGTGMDEEASVAKKNRMGIIQ